MSGLAEAVAEDQAGVIPRHEREHTISSQHRHLLCWSDVQVIRHWE